MPADDLYDRDFYAWARAQADAARRRADNEIDWENVTEEIESLSRSDRARARSQALNILLHLMKIDLIGGESVNHWRREIEAFRNSLKRALTPSLAKSVPAELEDLYESARLALAVDLHAYKRADLIDAIPKTCAYTWSDILGEG